MNIKNDLDKLTELQEKAAVMQSQLRDTMDLNTRTYQPDKAKLKNDEAMTKVQSQIATYAQQAQDIIDNLKIAVNKEVTAKLNVVPFTADMGAELDQLSKIELSKEDLEYYATKYQGTDIAIRRLNDIANKYQKKIAGPKMLQLNQLETEILSNLQAVVDDLNAIPYGSNLTAKVLSAKAINEAEQGMATISNLLQKEFTVEPLTIEDNAVSMMQTASDSRVSE